MPDPFLTASLTIIGSILILALGKIITDFSLEPLKSQRTIIDKIADCFIYDQNDLENLNSQNLEGLANAFRQNASLLFVRTHSILGYRLYVLLKLAQPNENIKKASKQLIELSDVLKKPKRDIVRIQRLIKNIKTNLGLATT